MTNPIVKGYLEGDYSQDPYGGGNVTDHFGMEVNLIINSAFAKAMQSNNTVSSSHESGMETLISIHDRPKEIALQTLQTIISSDYFASQIRSVIESEKYVGNEVRQIIIKDHSLGAQIDIKIGSQFPSGMEVNLMTGGSGEVGSEVVQKIIGSKSVGQESKKIIDAYNKAFAMQSRQRVQTTPAHGMEFRWDRSFPQHVGQTGYLETPYGEDPYLGDIVNVAGPMEALVTIIPPPTTPAGGAAASQSLLNLAEFHTDAIQTRMMINSRVQSAMEVEVILNKTSALGNEVKRIIEDIYTIAMETRRVIGDVRRFVGMQCQGLLGKTTGMQVNLLIYNSINLRVLWRFPSRGTSGLNWTSTSTQAGDFSPNNLNSDIIEQRFQSAAGFKTISLICDTEVSQGIQIDTIAVLDHNITVGGTIVLEGSTTPTFNSGTILQTYGIPVTKDRNIYFCVPVHPSEVCRYWRFQISDVQNPDGCIKIGTILMGSASILQYENITDTIRIRKTHFADKLRTEGFTNVTNDRALKKAISFDFRNLLYAKGNYPKLVEIIDYARTSLKCLWIPDPKNAGRFAVFGKLANMPEETHLNIGVDADYVDLSIEVDESL